MAYHYVVVRRRADLGVPGSYDKSLIVLLAAWLWSMHPIANISSELMQKSE